MSRFFTVFASGLMASLLLSGAAQARPKWVPDHIVLVIEENRSANKVYGNREMPYLNFLAAHGARMTNAHFAETPYGIIPPGQSAPLPSRPSQPNYFYLFSGNDQGDLPGWFRDPRSPYDGTAVDGTSGGKLAAPRRDTDIGVGDKLVPAGWRPFTTPNLGAALIRHGRSYATFSDSLPYPHFDGTKDSAPDNYRRKHNPSIDWVNLTGVRIPANRQRYLLPVSTNLAFAPTHDPVDHRSYRGFAKNRNGRPLAFSKLPTVSIVVPNEQHDGHSNSDAVADAWLRRNIKPYAEWAMVHNSLLIITYDEDGSTDGRRGNSNETGRARIATIFYGAGVKPGDYAEPVDHLNVLSTILDRYGLLQKFRREFAATYTSPESRNELANLRPIRDIFAEGKPLK